MNINEFVTERKEEWQRLENMLAKLRPGRAVTLSRDDLWQLGRLYSAAVSDLSVLRASEQAEDPDNPEIAYLNSLVVRVHGIVYRKERFRWSSVWEFLETRFPATFRKTILYTGYSALMFVFLGVVGFFLGVGQPGFVELLVPQHIIGKVERGQVWFKELHTIAPMASSMLITNNVSVTFLVFAAGITFGVGTLYLLALNGLLLGTVAALCFRHNLSAEFWAFVLPHGSLELSAIFIAGGAGLIMGHALVDPGPHRRTDMLSLRSKDASVLALGCVPLLVLAGLIEAFFSPSPLPAWPKFLFAVVAFLSLIAYLLLAGRQGETGPRVVKRP